MFNRESRPIITESLVESNNSVIESANSTANSSCGYGTSMAKNQASLPNEQSMPARTFIATYIRPSTSTNVLYICKELVMYRLFFSFFIMFHLLCTALSVISVELLLQHTMVEIKPVQCNKGVRLAITW